MNEVNVEYRLTKNNKKIAIATLNAPKSLNALNINMVDLLYKQLLQWQDNPEVVAVLLQGHGERAFCAGGDVVSLYQEHASGRLPLPVDDDKLLGSLAHQFFKQEYELDHLIHVFSKPIIVWGSGYVMGGGIGLFAGASHRIVTESTRMAMPEITIGLYPDVGGSYFLNKIEKNIGLFLALTGQSINAKDAKAIKLADFLLPNSAKVTLVDQLCEIKWSGNKLDFNKVDSVLTDIEKKSSHEELFVSLPDNIQDNHESIAIACQHSKLHQVVNAITEIGKQNTWLGQAAKKLSRGSSLSAAIIFKQLNVTKGFTLKACFLSELNLSLRCCQYSEFYEGVRALLVDKDNSPNWAFKSVTDVDQQLLESFFKPISAISVN